MISIDRFKALKNQTLYKKASLLISQQMSGHISLDKQFIDEIFKRISDEFPEDSIIHESIENRLQSEGLLVLKDYLDMKTGRMNADLDFLSDNDTLCPEKRTVRERYVVLDDVRSPYNLGSITRSSESFMVKEIILLSQHLSPDHPNARRAACRTDGIVNCRTFSDRSIGLEYIKSLSLPIFALECGGASIDEFEFPSAGIAVVGNEEFGISRELLEMSSAKISIPMFGCKGSISVSCATAIMLHAWCNGK
ncbi:MAG TPA: hypothetical protein DCO86_03315 [Spirochaetaceae bacterium]|nr:hypothetical protein [Spirochaetaceae bacterium]